MVIANRNSPWNPKKGAVSPKHIPRISSSQAGPKLMPSAMGVFSWVHLGFLAKNKIKPPSTPQWLSNGNPH